MWSVLLLGLLFGLQHAMEADHLAAVASLATRSRGVAQAARQGAIWGIGHTLTLLLFGGAVLVAGSLVPEQLAVGLEAAVGVMLILLGADVLRRQWQARVHFHRHNHGPVEHFHAHSHAGRSAHADDPHDHVHHRAFPLRSLLVGMMHGMAGSAALVVLALGAVTSPWQGLAYILVFGLGSIAGMTVLGMVIGLPLRWSAARLTWAHNGIQLTVGLFTLILGGYIVYRSGVSGILPT